MIVAVVVQLAYLATVRVFDWLLLLPLGGFSPIVDLWARRRRGRRPRRSRQARWRDDHQDHRCAARDLKPGPAN